MESERSYRVLFYCGTAWNFIIAGALLVLTGSLPELIKIEAPRYPIFIHFNLLSIFFFGWMQLIIARDLFNHRPFVKLLMWAKLGMAVVFVLVVMLAPPPAALAEFLAPGMVIDTLFGLAFWRFLVFSRRREEARG